MPRPASTMAVPSRTTLRVLLLLAVVAALVGSSLSGCESDAQTLPDEDVVRVNGAGIDYQGEGDGVPHVLVREAITTPASPKSPAALAGATMRRARA